MLCYYAMLCALAGFTADWVARGAGEEKLNSRHAKKESVRGEPGRFLCADFFEMTKQKNRRNGR